VNVPAFSAPPCRLPFRPLSVLTRTRVILALCGTLILDSTQADNSAARYESSVKINMKGADGNAN